MVKFTVNDLRRLLESSAGVVGIDWEDSRTLETSFDDIGYDSLALLEFSALLLREWGIRIPDEDVFEMTTPGLAIDYINRSFAAA